MKKIVCFLVLMAVAQAYIPTAFTQEMDEDVKFKSEEKIKMRPMKKMKKMRMKHMVSPGQLAKFDEETRAAWREIEELKLKKDSDLNIYLAISAAFAIGLAVLAGAFAQGKVASSAMDGIARNPEASSKMFTPLVISLALIESLVIYALVIAFLLHGKI